MRERGWPGQPAPRQGGGGRPHERGGPEVCVVGQTLEPSKKYLPIGASPRKGLMVIPLMWAAKMMLANVEFLHDMQGMPLDDIMNNHETESTADVDAFVLDGNGSSLRARRDGDSDLLTKKNSSEPVMKPWGFWFGLRAVGIRIDEGLAQNNKTQPSGEAINVPVWQQVCLPTVVAMSATTRGDDHAKQLRKS